MSIKYKMLLPMVIIVVVSITTVLVAAQVVFSSYMDGDYEQTVVTYVKIAQDKIGEMESQAKLAAAQVAEEDGFLSAVASGERSAIVSAAQRLRTEMGMDFLNVLDAQGDVIVRADNPDKFGDSLAAQRNVAGAMAGTALTTVETGSVTRLSIYSSMPIYSADGELAAIVSTGFRFDNNQFVDEMKALLGAEFTVFVGNERISTTIVGEDGNRLTGTTAGEEVSRTVLGGGDYTGQTQVVGKNAFVAYKPLSSSDGDIIGMLFAGIYSAEKDAVLGQLTLQSILIGSLMVVLSVVVIIVIALRLIAPIKTMVDAAEKLAKGDVDVDLQVNTKDEMRELAGAFNRMIEKTREQAAAIEAIAAGDLRVSVEARSDKDVVSLALGDMLDMNNEVFTNIMNATSQVSYGAQQVADGAQQLAQSNTEQAAAIDQLHGNLQQIAKNTEENARMSDEAASLSRDIRQSAHQGSEQMGRMMTAVKEINQASTSIGDVIKVIDNIAFQTNILALNASVEAARAGSNGRSFAVVAEEVRSLATKSADAAKDTAQLISDSIDKAAVGAQIAEETSHSLDSIVQGIEKSAVIVEEISKRSDEQAESIGQINESLEQMSQVVQTTSSLSEETAASSEEMSSQSKVLADMVSRFRLRDDTAALAGERPRMLGA